MINKNLNDIMENSWRKVIKKEMDFNKVFFFNMLRLFFLMRFFNVKYPIDSDVFFTKMNDIMETFILSSDENIFLKNFMSIVNKLINSKFLKNKPNIKLKLKEMNFTLKRYFSFLKKEKYFFLFKKFYFKGKKKKPYLLYKLPKKKKVLKVETEDNLFMKRFLKNRAKFALLYDYLIYRYKKSFKKKIIFLKKKRMKTYSFLQGKLFSYFIYKRQKRRKKKKYIKPKYRHWNLRNKFKRLLPKKKRIEYIDKIFNQFKNFRNKKGLLKYLFKIRSRKFRRKYSLIRQYKRIKFRRKKRTGILHFRSYYSNYYITLTDLSYKVISSFSAGLVSESNNKKTKMSKVIAVPIFFRILQYLKAYRIRNLKVVIRNRMDKMFYSALDFFKKKGYKFKSFSFVTKNAHHLGQRKKKPRRI